MPNEVVLFRSFTHANRRGRHIPHHDDTMRLANNFMDGKTPSAENGGGRDHGVGDMYQMIERLSNFINNDHVKALMSMGDAWTRAFTDRWQGFI